MRSRVVGNDIMGGVDVGGGGSVGVAVDGRVGVGGIGVLVVEIGVTGGVSGVTAVTPDDVKPDRESSGNNELIIPRIRSKAPLIPAHLCRSLGNSIIAPNLPAKARSKRMNPAITKRLGTGVFCNACNISKMTVISRSLY
jgi:hypothetical protein